ncbi:tetratricopeptide repeat protein [Endozoicomonas ascidiicola]|uniref:tetratricopeptide repeat protein n=1 Tax=Endozoicomonas ascidiicola TaxID=1698521 RepID=UPI000829FBDC|nr:hypothetical protein [Endozoicomonas ascidiicola]
MSNISRVDWNHEIHAIWLAGEHRLAIEKMAEEINRHGEMKPRTVILQTCYYLFLIHDYASCIKLLGNGLILYPCDTELLTNLASCYSRNHQYQEAIHFAQLALKKTPDDYYLWDTLTVSHFKLGQWEQAKITGTESLRLKDQRHGQVPEHWSLPEKTTEELVLNKINVIAFSLWGDKERYLHGALRNLLLAPEIYPDWEVWIYLDDTVPATYQQLMTHLGAKLIHRPSHQSIKQKTCWRFAVASDSTVGYFLIRDADSVISPREQNAVLAWQKSGKLFHIIRDWWTHTDLMLAGMWGGIAGVLPDIQQMVSNYQANHLETPNVDQWFLRDVIWQLIKPSCLIHDRCFQPPNASPVPGNLPEGNNHIGACEHALFPEYQQTMLKPWLNTLKR